MSEKKKMKLWLKILIGLGAGIITGIVLGPNAEYIKPIGTLFINAIKMLIVPLIFSSLVVGVLSMKDPKKMGRIGLKTFALYLATTAIAITIGVSKSVSSFVLPLGATINMDGTALYQGICALFIAQAYGVDLTLANYITIILTSTLASIGSAGVPGAGLIMLSLVLSSVGLPLEGIALVAGIDRILDMARTTVNVTGDAMVSLLIAKSENELDVDVYQSNPEPH